MNKTIVSLLLSLMSLTAYASCTTQDDEGPLTENPDKENQQGKPAEGEPVADNVLVAYFSCTKTTQKVAGEISEITGGKLFRIEPVVAYTAADLDYNSDCRANREQNDRSARPALKCMPENLKDYGVIFIGYPIWWGEAPRIISTFLESGDFKGKTIIPFCTSHSSGIGSSDKNLHALAKDAIWKDGKRFGSNTSKDEVERWIKNLKINFGN